MNSVDMSVREIMAAVFGIKAASIDAGASAETIEAWDSLQHLNLILALEERFGIQLSVDEITSVNNYASIVSLVSRHLNGRPSSL
jgi:acyl carrier protein